MEKEQSDKLIADAAKTLFSYCRTRTNSKEDAEGLSQDILLKLLKNRETLRDDKAFYGFMWTVAGNVYKDWCKKRKKRVECELDENISDESVPLAELLEKESDLRLLYRELGLLTEQYRKVVIQYYFNNCKVPDISKSMDISESMVKFLLFKSRKILKEGMNMEKTNGNLSFNPGKMSLSLLIDIIPDDLQQKEIRRSIQNLVNGNMIAQNILFACYNDRCTAEEISLQIGVAIPYLEKDLTGLCEKNLLIQKGGKYETNIVIFTKEFLQESGEKTLPIQREVAEILGKRINERLDDIKAIGFYRGVDNDSLLKWLVTHIILSESGERYYKSLNYVIPVKHAGIKALATGIERYTNESGFFTNMILNNANGDYMKFGDFSINGEPDCFYFNLHPNRVNIALDIAKEKNERFSENDKSEIAEFIKRGYAGKSGDKLSLKLPVFTAEQFEKIKILFEDVIIIVIEKMRETVNIATDILVQHTPASLKKEAENSGWIKARDFSVVTIKIMVDNDTLRRVADNEHPTAFVVLA
ncbi:MAG: sigma-70 family RNA polymerase sigma factor [Oscillospiraceae bacterium]|nr:sigma-70 family RNA polymerase sigma factor [Oscillospiraceae bacterium]